MKMQYNCSRSMGHRKSSAKWEVHINIGLPQDLRKLSNKQLKCTLKKKKNYKKKKPKVTRREEIVNIRVEINEIGT